MGHPLHDGEEFQLRPVTDEEITRNQYSDDNLWFLKIGETPQGPYYTDDLKAFLDFNKDFSRQTLARNLTTEEWQPLFEYSPFQRRKPQLVPRSELLESEDFYLVESGKIVGPYGIGEIRDKVSQHELLINDEVSVDAGKTWVKLYMHPEFDRRSREVVDELPYMPDESTFVGNKSGLLSKLKGESSSDHDDNSTQLIKLSQLKLEKKKNKVSESILPDAREELKDKQGKSKLAIYLVFFLAIFSVTVYMLFQEEKTPVQSVKIKKTSSPKLKPIEKISPTQIDPVASGESDNVDKEVISENYDREPASFNRNNDGPIDEIEAFKKSSAKQKRNVKKTKNLERPIGEDGPVLDEYGDEVYEDEDLMYEDDQALIDEGLELLPEDESLGELQDLDQIDSNNQEQDLFDSEIGF